MKKRKLKIEGEEKLKVELRFIFDEVYITLYEGGMPTKYKDVLTFQAIKNTDSSLELEMIGATISKLYGNYIDGKEVEKNLNELFVDKEYIEVSGLKKL